MMPLKYVAGRTALEPHWSPHELSYFGAHARLYSSTRYGDRAEKGFGFHDFESRTPCTLYRESVPVHTNSEPNYLKVKRQGQQMLAVEAKSQPSVHHVRACNMPIRILAEDLKRSLS
jgi:hypothetical protein